MLCRIRVQKRNTAVSSGRCRRIHRDRVTDAEQVCAMEPAIFLAQNLESRIRTERRVMTHVKRGATRKLSRIDSIELSRRVSLSLRSVDYNGSYIVRGKAKG